LESDGFEVDVAATGSEALKAASTHDYRLIILDLILPDIDGYQVLARLRADDQTQRVLVLSAMGEVESRVRCLRMGAVDYLVKPFAVAELIERVKRRIGDRPTPPRLRWLDAGGVRLDMQRRALHCGERNIPLSQREFILLGHLMRHANEVCTRGELLADVWGYSFDPGSNVVDVCVGRLRSKLEPELIETVRNVGYCFVAS
jgi:two-component system, OmpR family, response regulator